MPPLSGLTVLSLEQATTLPFLTQRLAREGARVIRVEAPLRGDPNRYVGSKVLDEEGMSSYFLPNNCGKESITLNLADPEGRDILHSLIGALPVDIFATNNRPSSYAKLGIDYPTIQTIRPQTIWLGITGFGPDSDEAAYDPILQARAGWMALNGEPEGDPLVFGLPLVDLGAAEHAYGAVMRALYRRARLSLTRAKPPWSEAEGADPSPAGRGARIDLSMFRSAVSWMASPLMLTALGETVTRRGNTHQYFAPVSVYPTRDGHVYLAVGNDRQWEALTQLPGFVSLARPVYQRNAGRIAAASELNWQMADCTRGWKSAELMAALNRIGVPVARVNSLPQVLAEPLILAGMSRARDERSGLEIALPPLAEVGVEEAPLGFPPRLGEHNEAVYGEMLGIESKRLAALRERGVI